MCFFFYLNQMFYIGIIAISQQYVFLSYFCYIYQYKAQLDGIFLQRSHFRTILKWRHVCTQPYVPNALARQHIVHNGCFFQTTSLPLFTLPRFFSCICLSHNVSANVASCAATFYFYYLAFCSPSGKQVYHGSQLRSYYVYAHLFMFSHLCIFLLTFLADASKFHSQGLAHLAV